MRKSGLAALILLPFAAYAAWPFVSLYRLDCAVRRHDVRALTADIDWDALRDGFKQDIADGLAGDPPSSQPVNVSVPASGGDDLPPFGSGFVSNMAGSMVDRTVTPEHLSATVGTLQAAGARGVHMARCFFTGPTTFVVAVRLAASGRHAPSIRLRMNLVRDHASWGWKVTRAWLPPDLLSATDSHAS